MRVSHFPKQILATRCASLTSRNKTLQPDERLSLLETRPCNLMRMFECFCFFRHFSSLMWAYFLRQLLFHRLFTEGGIKHV
jgi:hypothetical protein